MSWKVYLPAGCTLHKHPAGTKIALHSRVCLCVCVYSSAIITCAKLHRPLLCHCSHEDQGSYWKLSLQAQ